MRTVGIWVSGLLVSAIPFIFIGAVVALLACIFDAVGEHAPTGRSRASFQAEATPPEQVLALASADEPDHLAQRQASKHAHGDARHQHARRSSSPPPREAHLGGQRGKIAPLSLPGLPNAPPHKKIKRRLIAP